MAFREPPAKYFVVVTETPISPIVEEFLARYIDSVELLEILLLIAREGDRSWSAERLSTRLLTSRTSAERRLEKLLHDGLVKPDGAAGHFVFSPKDRTSALAVAELDRIYEPYRIRIIEIIFTKPSSTLTNFLNAFDMKRDKDV